MKALATLTTMTLLATISSCTTTRAVEEAETTTTVSMEGSIDGLKAYFSQHEGRLRFITLLSPT